MAEYIKRESVLAKIDEFVKQNIAHGFPVDVFDIEMMKKMVEKLPAADVAPVVHGRIVGSLEDGRYRRRFSCCGEDATMITQWAWPKYCPNCGAKMDGGADNG